MRASRFRDSQSSHKIWWTTTMRRGHLEERVFWGCFVTNRMNGLAVSKRQVTKRPSLSCRCMQTGSFPFRCVIHRGRAPPNRWKNQDCVDGWPASCMFVQFVRASGPDVNPEKFPWQASQLKLGLFKPFDLTCWGGAMV